MAPWIPDVGLQPGQPTPHDDCPPVCSRMQLAHQVFTSSCILLQTSECHLQMPDDCTLFVQHPVSGKLCLYSSTSHTAHDLTRHFENKIPLTHSRRQRHFADTFCKSSAPDCSSSHRAVWERGLLQMLSRSDLPLLLSLSQAIEPSWPPQASAHTESRGTYT